MPRARQAASFGGLFTAFCVDCRAFWQARLFLAAHFIEE
jgi:hypothetical protein